MRTMSYTLSADKNDVEQLMEQFLGEQNTVYQNFETLKKEGPQPDLNRRPHPDSCSFEHGFNPKGA